ncbi:hypothetical protein JS562_12065 [Agrobacterium sp. S2]|nr:hypothetical protein [Agrobacterium sp. S2]
MKPWEMDWSAPEEEKKPRLKPWEMDWSDDGSVKQNEPAQAETPALAEPSIDNLDKDLRVPKSLRVEVGALNKPEDRLKAMRKTFPNAQPYGDDNFIYTDPETGKTGLYNPEGLDWGDWGSLLPEVGEMIGAGVGAVGGAIGAGAAGSVVPILGTGAGAATGAVAGAGTGGAAGKDLVERGINWLYGNEDTRSTGEYLTDKAIDAGVNAAGEGVGRGVVAGFKAAKNGVKGAIAGRADNVADAAAKHAAYKEAGIQPTAGMVTGSTRSTAREGRLLANPNSRVAQAHEQAAKTLDDRYTDLVAGVAGPRGVTTPEGAGEALQIAGRQADDFIKGRINDAYDQTGDLLRDVRSPGKNVRELLQNFEKEKAAFGRSAELNKGSAIDGAIKQADALTTDAVFNGVPFNDLKETRTAIGNLAFGNSSASAYEQNLYKRLYGAVTADMDEAAKQVGQAGLDSLQAAEKANREYVTKGGTKEALKPFTKEADPIAPYKKFQQYVKEGNATAVDRMRTQMVDAGGEEYWRQSVGTMLDNMGRTPNADGVNFFNPKKFFADYNKIPDNVKDVMFKGTDLEKYRGDLDKLHKIAAYRAANPSKANTENWGTRALDVAMSGVGAVSVGPGGAIAGAIARPIKEFAANTYMDRLLTNPEFVGWLAGVPQAQMRKGGLAEYRKEILRIRRGASAAVADAIDQYMHDAGIAEE